MTKDVLVSVSGLQTAVNEMESYDDEPIEVINAGTYYFKDGTHYIFFEEVAEGIPGVTKTQIRLTGKDSLEVRKKGVATVNMVFEKNKIVVFIKHHLGKLILGFILQRFMWMNEKIILIFVQNTEWT